MTNKEIEKHRLRLMGYELLVTYERALQESDLCFHCQLKMTLEFIEFLRHWELITDSLYQKLKTTCKEGLEGETCEKE